MTVAPSASASAADSDLAARRAVTLRAEGRLADALAAAQAALAAGETPAALVNLGGLLVENGRAAEAEAPLRRALDADPGLIPGWWWLGLSLLEQGRPRAAAEALRKVFDDPGLGVGARAAYGRAMLAAERPAAAAEALAPVAAAGHPLLALELSQALEALGRTADAETALRRAADAAPDAPQLQAAQARLCVLCGRRDEAAERLDQARATARRLQGVAAALGWAAVAQESQRWFGPAAGEADLREALAVQPGDPGLSFALSQLLLARGDWREGWARHRERPSARRFDGQRAARPAPDVFNGARVVVAQDQGVGDEIFFWRFLPELARRGAQIVLAPSAKTAPLARRLGLCEQVAVDGVGVTGAVDHVILTGDLPWWLGWEGVAPSVRLDPSPAALAAAEAALAATGPRPWTGALWRSGAPGVQAFRKRAPRAALLELLRRRPGGIALFQRHMEPEERAAAEAALGRAAADLSPLTEDLEATLAALSLLDAYVGVSTADCHLLALLDRPARVLIPAAGDARWGAAGDASAWFPGCVVYREDVQTGWGDAFSRLRRDLG